VALKQQALEIWLFLHPFEVRFECLRGPCYAEIV
jgi:hypothetical protein